MKLSEFIRQKMEEYGLKGRDILNAGIGGQTWNNIMRDKQKKLAPVTMEKLARVLKCTQGELQACMAEAPDDRRKSGKTVSVMATVDAPEEMVKEDRPTVSDPKDEEPAEVFRPESEEEPEAAFPEEEPKKVPVREEAVPDEHPEEELKELCNMTKVIIQSNLAGRKAYCRELKNILLKVTAGMRLGEDSLEDMYAEFGVEVAKRLAAEEATGEEVK